MINITIKIKSIANVAQNNILIGTIEESENGYIFKSHKPVNLLETELWQIYDTIRELDNGKNNLAS